MDCYVYILKSRKNERHYVGCSSDVSKRLKQHNQCESKSTAPHRPYDLIYSERYRDQKSAFSRERQIKSYKGGKAFKKLIEYPEGVGGGVVNRNRL